MINRKFDGTTYPWNKNVYIIAWISVLYRIKQENTDVDSLDSGECA
jgi:hypothetical protein